MERRTFLAATSVSAASYRRVLGANDRIGVGIIGIGNIGVGQHIRGLKALEDQARIVAVCDIYTPRLDRGITLTSAKGYHAYVDQIADRNVDAVIVATPDHWHAKMAIDAMRA
ncbi:MAG: Gfo/Idh/MocA family oxidoreductase, partial [Acidobacteria bacterium]|nr:Gfo/Idh/MocA family oxidoreductase [Acidobacteriota bacterium]